MVAVSKVLQVIFRHEIFIISLICALCSLWSGIANIPSKLQVPPDSLNTATPPEMNNDVYVWSHISDVHFIDNKTKAAKAFYKFDSEVLPVVNPNLIVISGDIVDSRSSNHPTQQKKVSLPLNNHHPIKKDLFAFFNFHSHNGSYTERQFQTANFIPSIWTLLVIMTFIQRL